MKAIVVKEFGDADVCKLVSDAPIPDIQSDEVLIRVYAAGVNPADTYIRSGTYYRLPNLPYTPGFDAAGVIERVGDGVTKFKPGDRVFTTSTLSGAYAEYCSARSKNVNHLPSNLSFEEGSALGVPYFTAYRALFIKGHAKPNETVLIHGASGGVGIPAVQLAKAHGMFVIGTASTEQGLQAIRDQGADLVFNHKKEGYLDEIANAIKDRNGIDLVLEMLANVNLNNDLNLLKPRIGRVVVVGNRGTVDINPRLLMIRETSVCGVILYQSTDEEYQMMAAHLQSGFQHGYLKPLLGRVYSLEEVVQAHTDIIHSSGAHGRITIKTRE